MDFVLYNIFFKKKTSFNKRQEWTSNSESEHTLYVDLQCEF